MLTDFILPLTKDVETLTIIAYMCVCVSLHVYWEVSGSHLTLSQTPAHLSKLQATVLAISENTSLLDRLDQIEMEI